MLILFPHNRCKHRCKRECSHACCQRKRDHDSSNEPREYHFQQRLPESNPQSTINLYLRPTSESKDASSGIPQKRKADRELEELICEDDPEAPQDLLSRLDRLTAEADRVTGTERRLRVPVHLSVNLSATDDGSKSASVFNPLQSDLSSSELLARARQGMEVEPSVLPKSWHQHGADSRDGAPGPSTMTYGPILHEGPTEPLQRVTQRPAQSRFVRSLGQPPWFNSSGRLPRMPQPLHSLPLIRSSATRYLNIHAMFTPLQIVRAFFHCRASTPSKPCPFPTVIRWIFMILL